ncbi:hypothetical protein ACFJIV_26735 [Mucilaginibacter sp. UC70_90]
METIQNLILGVASSIIASVLFLFYVSHKDKEKEKKKYAASVGEYIGYGPTVPNGDIVDMKSPLSNVEIIYEGGNLLKLVLKEINNSCEWHGLISMESNNYGTIVWRYDTLNGNKVDQDKHRFGLKKFVYFPKGNKRIAYLVDDIEKGFGNEILFEKIL